MALAPQRAGGPGACSASRRESSRVVLRAQQVHGEQTVESRLISPHADAQRRRKEAEERQQKRELERLLERTHEERGFAWFEGEQPANCHYVTSRVQLDALMQRAKSQSRLLVLNFFTEDCYSCRTLHPKLMRLAEDNQDVLFAKLNGSLHDLQSFFAEEHITRVPFFHFHVPSQDQPVAAFSANLNPEKLAHLRREVVLHKQAVAEMQQHHQQGQGMQQQLDCLKEQQLQLQLQ